MAAEPWWAVRRTPAFTCSAIELVDVASSLKSVRHEHNSLLLETEGRSPVSALFEGAPQRIAACPVRAVEASGGRELRANVLLKFAEAH